VRLNLPLPDTYTTCARALRIYLKVDVVVYRTLGIGRNLHCVPFFDIDRRLYESEVHTLLHLHAQRVLFIDSLLG